MSLKVHGKMAKSLSARSRQVLDVVYRMGEVSASDIQREAPDVPSYSAVRATLSVLEEKGHVEHEPDGRRYLYQPTVRPEKARSDALMDLVRTYFDGSAEHAAVALLRMSDSALSESTIERLADEIELARKDGR